MQTGTSYTVDELIKIIDHAASKGAETIKFPGHEFTFKLPYRPQQQRPTTPIDDVSRFVTAFGKYRGRTLGEMGPEKVRSYGEWILEHTNKEELSEQAGEWIGKADIYLRQNG